MKAVINQNDYKRFVTMYATFSWDVTPSSRQSQVFRRIHQAVGR